MNLNEPPPDCPDQTYPKISKSSTACPPPPPPNVNYYALAYNFLLQDGEIFDQPPNIQFKKWIDDEKFYFLTS
jgi:hypothetical protein